MLIKEQVLPKEMKAYCKNVLHFLAEKGLCGFNGNGWAPVELLEHLNEEQQQEEDE